MRTREGKSKGKFNIQLGRLGKGLGKAGEPGEEHVCLREERKSQKSMNKTKQCKAMQSRTRILVQGGKERERERESEVTVCRSPPHFSVSSRADRASNAGGARATFLIPGSGSVMLELPAA